VYDRAGQVIAQVDERGNSTEFEYDDAGRQTLVRDALDFETTTSYDRAGRRTSVTDALGHTTRFAYDNLGRLTTTTFADGTTTKTAYDNLGRAVSQTDQLDRTTRFQYDDLGRLTEVIDALMQTTAYEYDEAGNLITQTDANQHTTRYEYDGLGRRTATVLPLGQRSTTTYDRVGNVVRTTDFNGQTIAYRYDTNNRLTTKDLPGASDVTITYTPTGQRATVTDARGTTRYAYDLRDRLLSRTDPDGRVIAYTYDDAGNRTSVAIPSGTTTYTFDELNRPETVTDPDDGVTTYTYDAAGRLVRTDFPNDTFETREYDDVGHLTFLENRGPTGVIASYRYTLAATGLRDAVVEDTGRRVSYQYDLLDRLIDEGITDAVNGDRTIRYTYDPVGNRTSRADSAEGTTTYDYDANDRLLTETLGGVETTYEYDANGNTTSRFTSATDQALYDWDAENRLIGATVTKGQDTKEIAYRYDLDGLRVTSVVDGDEVRFLIDANLPYAQVLEEYTPGGTIQASYVHGLDLISQERDGDRSYYHVDGLGSTRALTDEAGLVTDRYIYDAFGRTIGQDGTTGNVYLFAGEQRDLNVGLDYLRARYLNVGTGRFYGMDPFEGLLTSPVSLHSFVYANANPTNVIDPSGEISLALVVATFAVLEVVSAISPQPVFAPATSGLRILTLDITVLHGSTDYSSLDIADANDLLRRNGCGLVVTAGKTRRLTASRTSAILGNDGSLDVPDTALLSSEEITLVKNQSRLTGYYIPAFSDSSTIARAMAQPVHGYDAVVLGPVRLDNVLPHELAHVLLRSGSHSPDPKNLLFAYPPGNSLTMAQCKTIIATARQIQP
jgi:RHS repeat-associated protein